MTTDDATLDESVKVGYGLMDPAGNWGTITAMVTGDYGPELLKVAAQGAGHVDAVRMM